MTKFSTNQVVGTEALRAKAAARFLGISIATFWRWTALGKLPKGVRLSARATIWRRGDLEAFLDRCAEGSQ